MHQNTQWMSSAVVVWSFCISVVSAQCSDGLTNSCGLSRQAMIGIIAAGVALAVSLAVCSVCCRRRRYRNRNRRDRSNINAPKPFRTPIPSGYSVYYQATPPPPPPVHTPQFPPRGRDTYQNQLRSQPVSPPTLRTTAPTAPVSSVSMRAPSEISSGPISSLDTPPLSHRSSVYRPEPVMSVPSSPSSPYPISPRNTRRSIAEATLPPLPASPPPRTPPLSAASSPPPPSAPTPRINPPAPFAMTSMHTGTSYNNTEEPPPAYTPI